MTTHQKQTALTSRLVATLTVASTSFHTALTERHRRLRDTRDTGDAVQTALITAGLGLAAVVLVGVIVTVLNKYGGKIGGL